MLFGAHVSIQEGISKAPLLARKIGCEVFQFFTRSPYGGKASPLTLKEIQEFKKACTKFHLKEYYIHTPYFINLASLNNRIRYGSIKVIREELERGTKLKARYVMTHLGSAKGNTSQKEALEKTVKSLEKVLENYQGSCQLLLEISAGSGEIIGDSFEELAYILNKIKPKYSLNICFDTCHAFASGYDLRTKGAVKETLEKFDKIIGLEKIKLIHANDSKGDLNSHIDRHEHIGRGKIGLEGFKALVEDKRLKNINFIIETPKENNWDVKNLETLKKLRKKL